MREDFRKDLTNAVLGLRQVFIKHNLAVPLSIELGDYRSVMEVRAIADRDDVIWREDNGDLARKAVARFAGVLLTEPCGFSITRRRVDP